MLYYALNHLLIKYKSRFLSIREWSIAPDLLVNRIVPGVAALNGQIYVVGGEQESNSLSSCECYDPQLNCWTLIASMIVPRCEFGLCALNGYLYALGGWIGDDIGGCIERYDTKIDEWRHVGVLPEPRFSMGVVAYKGTLKLNLHFFFYFVHIFFLIYKQDLFTWSGDVLKTSDI